MATNPFWSPAIHALEPYVPGEQPQVAGLVKLNTNENPYPPSPAVLRAIQDAANADLRRYPDPDGQALKRALAHMHGLEPAQVFLGHGSDEVLAHVFCALLRHDLPILFPDVSYGFYPVYCALYGITFSTVAVDHRFRIDLQAYPARPNGGIVFPNPNAPTGIALELDALRTLLKSNTQSVVVVDEAYVDFGAQSAVPLVREFPNLLVVQTFSKSRSLAGLRVGFALGDAGLVEALERVKDSFNSYPLDRLALAGALAALADSAYFEDTRRRIMDSRAWLAQQLGSLGMEVLASSANFLFARHPRHPGSWLQQQLRARKLLVRHFAKARIEDWLRITIGTPQECAQLVHGLKAVLHP